MRFDRFMPTIILLMYCFSFFGHVAEMTTTGHYSNDSISQFDKTNSIDRSNSAHLQYTSIVMQKSIDNN
jgi:hypothetical protein